MLRLPAIAALLAAIGLASCGGGEGRTDASASTTGRATPAAVAEDGVPRTDAATGSASATSARSGSSVARATPTITTPGERRTVPRGFAGRTFEASEVDGRRLAYGSMVRIEFGKRYAVAFTGFEHDRVRGFVGRYDVSIHGHRLRFDRPSGGSSAAAPGTDRDVRLDDQQLWLANWLPSRPEFELKGRNLTLHDADVRIRFTE